MIDQWTGLESKKNNGHTKVIWGIRMVLVAVNWSAVPINFRWV